MRILVVDDDPSLLDNLRHALSGDSVHIVFKDTVKSALAAIRNTDFCAFLVAVTMPNFNGVGLIRHIRRLHPQTLIIACGGRSETTPASTALMLALASGADRILYKPLSPYELRAALEVAPAAADQKTKATPIPKRARNTSAAAALRLPRQPAKTTA